MVDLWKFSLDLNEPIKGKSYKVIIYFVSCIAKRKGHIGTKHNWPLTVNIDKGCEDGRGTFNDNNGPKLSPHPERFTCHLLFAVRRWRHWAESSLASCTGHYCRCCLTEQIFHSVTRRSACCKQTKRKGLMKASQSTALFGHIAFGYYLAGSVCSSWNMRLSIIEIYATGVTALRDVEAPLL